MLRIGEGHHVARGGFRARAAFAFLLLTLCGLASTAADAQISVSSGGSPSYGVSIAVPPGIAGMSPNLSLAFTGGGVNGPAGYGWTLTGVSIITRCPGNASIDGKPIAVKYSTGDRLCLDGQRLVQTSTAGVPVASTPSANGALLDAAGRAEDGSYTEYRTDKDIYSRIRAYGMANGATSNGPRYFKVWTKAGQIYEYGAGPSADPATTNALIVPSSSSVAAAWAVARISDTVGNFIDFKYSSQNVAWGSGTVAGTPTTGHEWNLAEIQYTGTATQAAANKIVLEYETRPDTPGAAQDRSEAYHVGSKNVSTQRLKTIRTYVNWPAPALGVILPGGALATPPSTAVKVKAVKLTYEIGSTGRSRIISTRECVGAAETTCLPGSSFHYTTTSTSELYTPSAGFNASPLATLPLEKADGTVGMLLGDFNGDGKTDIVRWSTTAGQNLLYTSNGDGTFAAQTGFGLAGVTLFDTAGCYASMVMDFNGDGKADILRIMHPTGTNGSCGTPVSILYLSKGDGTFTPVTLPSSISFAQTLATYSQTQSCNVPNVKTGNAVPNAANASLAKGAAPAMAGSPGCTNPHWVYGRTGGANYHILDVNGDGVPDIVTTVLASYSQESAIPAEDDLCGAVTCTHVYLGSPTGTFTEYTTTNLAHHSVYGPPRSDSRNHFRPYIGDADGDGLMDLMVNTGTWRSLGSGDFTLLSPFSSGACSYPLDFNGDSRADCLFLNGPASPNTLNVGDGSGSYPSVAGFNLAASGTLTPLTTAVGAGVGVVLADLDADGRTDLIRWADDPTQNAVYLSNGDGTFRKSALFNLNTAAYGLKKSDGTIDFVTGDFTGNGNTEILRTVSTITTGSIATTNQLFVKSTNTPPDQLSSMTTSTGLSSTLTYVTLPNSNSGVAGPRYQPGPSYSAPAAYPKVDLTIPMWVVATVENATGVGSTTTKEEYAYGGLRASMAGYGLLGFATVREQHTAADGSPLTTVTSYLQDGGYIGVAGVTQTLDGPLSQPTAALISRTTNAYCDTTSAASPAAIATAGTAPIPCATTAVVQRPYLYQSLEEGWDIDPSRTALPTVRTTNTFNGSGDATNITVTTVGTSLGIPQTVTKTTSNVFYPDTTSGDSWILGRLNTSTQTNTVPNMLARIATSAGSGKYASATSGMTLSAVLSTAVVAGTTVGQSSTFVATLTNGSGGTLGLTAPAASSVAGTDFSFVSTTCATGLAQSASCSVTIKFAPTAALTRSGTLSIQTEAGLKSVGFTGQGLTPATLTLTNCANNSPATYPATASETCTVGNSGQSSATGIQYASSSGNAYVSAGPSTCTASTASCGTVTVTSPVNTGTWPGNIVATPASGNAASAPYNLVVVSPAQLVLGSCTTISPVAPPSQASQTCTLMNIGQIGASGIVYSVTPAGMSISGGPTSCAASIGSCGTVTVTTPGSSGAYAGNLVATASSGATTSSSFNLTVYTQAALALTNCAANSGVTAPSQASETCTVANNGQTAATGIVFASSLAGTTVGAGPTSCAAGTANCGSVTVSTPGIAGSYAGSLTATPALGSSASAGFSLLVDTPATLTLSGCAPNSGTTTPTSASQTCTVGNSGQTAASGIVYGSTLGGMSLGAGPTTCAAGATNCGTVTITSPGAAGTYAGSLTASPASGSAAAAAFSLTVYTQATLTLTNCTSNSPATYPTTASETCTVGNSGQSPATGIQYTSSSGNAYVSAGPSTCAANTASCGTVTVTSPVNTGTWPGNIVATPASGNPGSAPYNLVVVSPAQLVLGSCTTISPVATPSQASQTCTLMNIGQIGASGIVYSVTPAGMSISGGPTSCAASIGSCGTVTVTTPGASGTYAGNLVATASSGATTSAPFNLAVLGQPVLTLTGCSLFNAQTPPAQSSVTCTVGNSGPSAATGISYASTLAGVTLSLGPATCAAQTASCGPVSITVPSVSGNYVGNLVATPSVGTAASAGFSLHENTVATLAFTGCSTVTPATLPTVASMSCSLVNNGESAAASISYADSAAGTTYAGPTGACGAGANCGTVTVSATTAGTFSGQIQAAPFWGIAGSAAFSFTELNPPTQTFTVSSNGLTSTFTNPNAFAVTPTGSGMNSTDSGDFSSIRTNTCTSAVPAGGSCQIVIAANAPDCKQDDYTVQAYVTAASVTVYGQQVSRNTNTGMCR